MTVFQGSTGRGQQNLKNTDNCHHALRGDNCPFLMFVGLNIFAIDLSPNFKPIKLRFVIASIPKKTL
jgi:hypothetical protein